MPIGVSKQTVISIGGGTGSINGTVDNPSHYHCHRFYFEIGSAATIQIQGSYDGTTFFDLLGAAVTTDGEVRELDRPWNNLRVKVTGNNGTTKVTVEQFYGNMGATV